MRVLASLMCRLIGHRRSAKRAYIDADEQRWRSYCRRCQVPMRKHGLYGWQVVTD